jgi:hypothetical protein
VFAGRAGRKRKISPSGAGGLILDFHKCVKRLCVSSKASWMALGIPEPCPNYWQSQAVQNKVHIIFDTSFTRLENYMYVMHYIVLVCKHF